MTSPTTPNDIPDASRERFQPNEVTEVLAHFDIGTVQSVRDYPHGSRRSPKARISASTGNYLLKRRADGRSDPFRVAFSHELQLALEEKGYPVAGLIGTSADNNSILQLGDRVYELFRYVQGDRYDRSVRATALAGLTLGELHRLLARHQTEFTTVFSSYHNAPEIMTTLRQLASTIIPPEDEPQAVTTVCQFLAETYAEAGTRVNDLGFANWRPFVLHGDWHPGNLVYKDERVVAVLDFDSARIEPRVVDVANGLLQFSMSMRRSKPPERWPIGLDIPRLESFIRHYNRHAPMALTSAERASIPWLMVEALIVEGTVPIAEHGSFGGIPAWDFLQMIERTVRWFRPRIERLAGLLDQSA